MIVPNMIIEKFVDEKGFLTVAANQMLYTLLQNLQLDLSEEGFVNPSVDSAADIARIAASLGLQGGAQKGTVIFDPNEINGGSSSAPNGQLKVLLADGTFHPITNT